MVVLNSFSRLFSKRTIAFPGFHVVLVFFSLLLLFLSLSIIFPRTGFPAEIRLAWDANTESDLAGYKVYYGTASRTYGAPVIAGKVTAYTVTNLTAGQTYYIAVTAYDTSNNESGYSNEVSGIANDPGSGLRIALKAGSNMVAFPNISGDVAVPNLLSSISGQYKTVFGYRGCDAGDPWKMYDPALPSFVNDLQTLNSTVGVWIDMKQDAELNIAGAFPSTLAIPLCAGWNLISYSGNQARSVADVLSSISGKYQKIYTYKSSDSADPWKLYDPSLPAFVNDLTVMEPGSGYWIYINQDCNLVVNNL